MSRGTIEDLPVPVALGRQLPAIYQDLDSNVMRLTEAFDLLLAPAWLVLDNVDAYFDPAVAPDDFVTMLAGWVGLEIDKNWRDEQLRHLVARAVELYRWRGTLRGVKALVEAYTGVEPEVVDTGATAWSAAAGSPMPGRPNLAVQVRVRLPRDANEDLARLTRLIAENVPAHVRITVEITRTEG